MFSGSAGFQQQNVPTFNELGSGAHLSRLVEELAAGRRCSIGMADASHFRRRAEHLRKLADMTWQPEIAEMLEDLARDYDEVAEDREAGRSQVRHEELLG